MNERKSTWPKKKTKISVKFKTLKLLNSQRLFSSKQENRNIEKERYFCTDKNNTLVSLTINLYRQP